jgi:26S proteasome regulatory subunit N10
MVIDSHTEHNDEDAELQAALAMSMNDHPQVQEEDENMEDLSEEDELQRALEMSMNEGDYDEEMMSAVLGSLPGVDKNDERIQKALEDMDKKKKDEKK